MRTVDQIIASFGELKAANLIPLLQKVQDEQGYLSRSAMLEISSALRIAPSKVYGVATFYNQFRFAPLGRHLIQVCRGTACHVKQSLLLAQHLDRRLKLRSDGNSRDHMFTVQSVACLGACSIAPAIKLDGEFYGQLTVEKLDKLLDDIIAAEQAQEVRDHASA